MNLLRLGLLGAASLATMAAAGAASATEILDNVLTRAYYGDHPSSSSGNNYYQDTIGSTSTWDTKAILVERNGANFDFKIFTNKSSNSEGGIAYATSSSISLRRTPSLARSTAGILASTSRPASSTPSTAPTIGRPRRTSSTTAGRPMAACSARRNAARPTRARRVRRPATASPWARAAKCPARTSAASRR